jgi:hypothetical protein
MNIISYQFLDYDLKFLKDLECLRFFFEEVHSTLSQKSSMKVIKYLLPLNEPGVNGPYLSVCINSKGIFVWY